MSSTRTAILLQTSFTTITSASCVLEYMGLNNTHSSGIVVTIQDVAGNVLFSEAIVASAFTELRFPSPPFFLDGIKIKAATADKVYAFPVYRNPTEPTLSRGSGVL